jgi:hypothetical protein
MRFFKLKYGFFIYSFLQFVVGFHVYAQPNTNVIIKGTVVDAETNEPVPFVGVELVGTNTGTITNMDGQYNISTKGTANIIKFSSIGYDAEVKSVSPGRSQIINAKLKPTVVSINEVIVKPDKKKYKNKKNPSVELIEKVIENKSKNRKEGLDSYEYEKYEKTQFALSNFSEKLKQRKAFKKFKFVFDNVDSTTLAGSRILPVYLKETLSDYYYRKSPRTTKEIVKANKMVSFEGYIDNQGMTEYLKYLYQDINIYDNDITFLTNQFLSPIAITAPSFYKYFIQDTSIVEGNKCVKLFFSPRNKTDLLFNGLMYIRLDSSYVVKRIEMSVNRDINLNWVKDVKIVQEFNQIQDKGWLLTTDEISIDFGLTKSGMGVFGQRTVSYKDYKVNEKLSDSIFQGVDIVQNIDADKKSSAFWNTNRHQPLSKSENGVYTVIDSIKKVPTFKRTMDIMMLIISGYKDFGYFEIGPVNTFYSYNPIEGVRLRFGGRTTPNFSKKINFETYLAYGNTDKKYKYYLGTAYSLTDKTIYNFPVKSVKFSIQDETKIPGQELQFVQEDNILLSIKRGDNNKLLYNKTFKIEHLNEFENHFSYTFGYSYTKQSPAGNLYFQPTGYLPPFENTPHINISEVSATLRYAPHEQFYQGKVYRIPIINKYPIFQLQYTVGSKRLKNDYNYQNLRLSISKRFYLSVFGYTDVIWEAGKIFGRVPYPLLTIHRANQTYSYQITSYNLMNFLEFVSDQYTSLNIDHCFNGFIFNKVPVIKKLKLREVATCKVLYGSLKDSNNPNDENGLFKLPVDSEGTPTTYTLEKNPYIEASVGISNIFKFFRIDVVKRLTYLDHPNVAGTGIRARFKFDF